MEKNCSVKDEYILHPIKKHPSDRESKLNLAFSLCLKQDDIRFLGGGGEVEGEAEEEGEEEQEEEQDRGTDLHIAAWLEETF